MAIRIKRNEAGNCITFEGSSNPVYWNSCLSSEVDSSDNSLINVINDIRTAQNGSNFYEFYRIPYTDFLDANGNSFASASDCVTYINQEANVLEATLAGFLNLENVSGSNDKVDLTSVTSQEKIGGGIKFTAGSNIQCGQPVFYNYSSTGVVTAVSAGTLPSQHDYIGIALKTVTTGEAVNVLTKGLVTAKRDTTFLTSSETVILNNTSNNTTRNLTNSTTFVDSGNTGGNYTSNENYSITFDAQSGYTAKVVVNSIAFEHSTSRMYDRLGIQGSNDGVNFTNLSVTWLQTSSTSSPTWSEFFAGNNSWNSTGSDNGYIFPKDTTRAALLSSGSFPVTLNTGYRYIRFYFRSDTSATDSGWNMTLSPNTPYSTNIETVAEGTTLYLDSSDYTKITTDDTSQIVVGYCAYNDAANDSIFIRV
jgi:predicted RecA/RadA family phage recombinase